MCLRTPIFSSTETIYRGDDISNKHWEEIFAVATEFLNASRKRKRSQSASSHASLDFIVDIEPEYTFVSDSD